MLFDVKPRENRGVRTMNYLPSLNSPPCGNLCRLHSSDVWMALLLPRAPCHKVCCVNIDESTQCTFRTLVVYALLRVHQTKTLYNTSHSSYYHTALRRIFGAVGGPVISQRETGCLQALLLFLLCCCILRTGVQSTRRGGERSRSTASPPSGATVPRT